jgi:hypothetical protein
MAFDVKRVRDKSLATAHRLGYAVNPDLPLIGETTLHRTNDEIVDRVLAMYATAASAYGFDADSALTWVDRESAGHALTKSERAFLTETRGDAERFKAQVESIWALAWSICVVPVLDFSRPCADDFVFALPDIKRGASTEEFRKKATMRALSEILPACDLAYCLHWAIRDAQLRGVSLPGKVDRHVVIERRRALEWLLHDANWEDIPLDT